MYYFRYIFCALRLCFYDFYFFFCSVHLGIDDVNTSLLFGIYSWILFIRCARHPNTQTIRSYSTYIHYIQINRWQPVTHHLLCMRVCMTCVCMHACMYVCIYDCIYVWIWIIKINNSYDYLSVNDRQCRRIPIIFAPQYILPDDSDLHTDSEVVAVPQTSAIDHTVLSIPYYTVHLPRAGSGTAKRPC